MRKEGRISYFFLRRLHSFLGLFPLGVFIIFCFYINSSVFSGPENYDKYTTFYYSLPLITFFEIIFIVIPLLFHAVFGLIIFYTSRNNFWEYCHYNNIAFFLQRLTGVIVLFFIILYTFEVRVIPMMNGSNISFTGMQKILTPHWVKWFYLLGILSLSYHFTNGVRNFFATFGFAASKRSKNMMLGACLFSFVVMSLWGCMIFLQFI